MNILFEDTKGTLYQGDSIEVLKNDIDIQVDMCITSPPYWTLRDYGIDGQLGQESSFHEYLEKLLNVFDACYSIIKNEGSLWVNLGDTYYGSRKDKELPRKSLCNIPSRFSIGMQDRGWILRNKIIWKKPNALVTPTKDRFTVDFEELFWFVKRPIGYYFNQQLEPYTTKISRWGGQKLKARGISSWDSGTGQNTNRSRDMRPNKEGRNKRTVWDINTEAKVGLKHYATYPEKLIETPIKATCPTGGIVLDLFFGSGTTGVVAEKLNRRWVGIELNSEYCQTAIDRILEKRVNNGD